MAAGTGLTLPIVSLSEAQAYLRVESGDEEALLAGLIRTASAVCESFINQLVVAREFEFDVPGAATWERVPVTPVRSISDVESVDSTGTLTPLTSDSYAVDIDSAGDGWVRLLQPAAAMTRLRIGGTAGIADEENGVPEPIRQGVLRLVAHLFSERDGVGREPPAAVTALWRPYRRMRLA